MQDELLDLVNEQDEVIGTIWRSQAYAQNRLFQVRAVWLLIRNQDGKFWIPRRHATKVTLPNALDGSAVGHVGVGESYEQAMIREVAEELNLDMMKMQYRFVGAMSPKDGTASFVQLFESIVPNGFVIDYNRDDFSEFYWFSSKELIDKIESGDLAKPSLIKIIKRFYIV